VGKWNRRGYRNLGPFGGFVMHSTCFLGRMIPFEQRKSLPHERSIMHAYYYVLLTAKESELDLILFYYIFPLLVYSKERASERYYLFQEYCASCVCQFAVYRPFSSLPHACMSPLILCIILSSSIHTLNIGKMGSRKPGGMWGICVGPFPCMVVCCARKAKQSIKKGEQ
jgi:hypothetical protein